MGRVGYWRRVKHVVDNHTYTYMLRMRITYAQSARKLSVSYASRHILLTT